MVLAVDNGSRGQPHHASKARKNVMASRVQGLNNSGVCKLPAGVAITPFQKQDPAKGQAVPAARADAH